jgi:signal transduction histidine kinase
MTQKWRPRLHTIIIITLGIALLLPLCGLLFFRVYETQLIRQAEGELITQSAVIASVFRQKILAANLGKEQLGAKVTPKSGDQRYHPIEPQLDLATDIILPRRPDALAAKAPIDPAFLALGQTMMPILLETQDLTLAGFRLTDPHGNIIAGKSEIGLSLAGVPEIADALSGRAQSVLRTRVLDQPAPPLYSVSRGTRVRVFFALPVIVNDQVAGVIYASRTPNNIVKYLFSERWTLALASLAVLSGTALLGLVVSRTLTGPLLELTDRTRKIVSGDRDGLKPLVRNGTVEMAELSTSLLTMAQQLQDRSDQISVFATHVSHELKSPLTSIQGAAELIRDSAAEMPDATRKKFLDNIIDDTARLTVLTRRLMELAKAQNQKAAGATSSVNEALDALGTRYGLEFKLAGQPDLRMAIAPQSLAAIIGNLAHNASNHSATIFAVGATQSEHHVSLSVHDNGSGISAGNAERMFDLFFTTRRDDGGTGMGLGIVKAILQSHNGSIRYEPSKHGAAGSILSVSIGCQTSIHFANTQNGKLANE